MNWPEDYDNHIICGDCRDVMKQMPDESVDIVVTSPPYNQLGFLHGRVKGWSVNPGMFKNNSWHRKIREGHGYPDYREESNYQEWLCGIISDALRVTKGLVWVNHKTRYRKGVAIHPLSFLNFPVWSEIVWARNGGIAMNCKRFCPSHEFVYGFGKPHYWDDDYNRLLSVWDIPASTGDGHPCSFPVELPKRLILASCPPGGIVLDMFLGSGTTAVAAKELGRKWIGIEMEEKYCAIAKERLRQEILPFGLI